MPEAQPLVLDIKSGIQRDGTQFDCDSFVDGKWARWQNGRARKMGGYRVLTKLLPSIVRGGYMWSKAGFNYLHLGFATQLNAMTIDNAGNVSTLTTRTPAGFVSDPNNMWQFDVYRDTVVNKTYIVAHAAPNAADISSSTTTKLWYGEMTNFAAAMADTTATAMSGGVVVVHPYIIFFGSDGFVQWNVPGNATDWTNVGSGSGYVTSQKIVRGLPLRGSSSGPGFLLWSLDAVVRATFTSTTSGTWQFDELTTNSSILSAASVIEHDGIYYWAGVDRFLSFNGVIREIPNVQSLNWFFDNINMAQRQKVYATKVPKYGEIWWCFPYGNATECTHALVFNYRENCWYDTILPDSGRAWGQYPVVYSYPIMAGVVQDSTSLNYVLWQHEYGLDRIDGAVTAAIESYVQTKEISFIDLPQNAMDRDMMITRMEPDLDQSGNMILTVVGRSNARSTAIETDYTIYVSPTTIQQVIPIRNTHRIVSFKFDSNLLGGNYFLGKIIIMIQPETAKVLGYGG